MSFGINKCETIAVKPINFKKLPRYENPSFYIGKYSILKVAFYTYLGILFETNMNKKKKKKK